MFETKNQLRQRLYYLNSSRSFSKERNNPIETYFQNCPNNQQLFFELDEAFDFRDYSMLPEYFDSEMKYQQEYYTDLSDFDDLTTEAKEKQKFMTILLKAKSRPVCSDRWLNGYFTYLTDEFDDEIVYQLFKFLMQKKDLSFIREELKILMNLSGNETFRLMYENYEYKLLDLILLCKIPGLAPYYNPRNSINLAIEMLSYFPKQDFIYSFEDSVIHMIKNHVFHEELYNSENMGLIYEEMFHIAYQFSLCVAFNNEAQTFKGFMLEIFEHLKQISRYKELKYLLEIIIDRFEFKNFTESNLQFIVELMKESKDCNCDINLTCQWIAEFIGILSSIFARFAFIKPIIESLEAIMKKSPTIKDRMKILGFFHLIQTSKMS